MATYKKNTSVGGKWAKTSELTEAKWAKIVSETNPQPSTFLDKNGNAKTQDVCKVQFDGQDEAMNVSLNRATINGLVDAFGEDSADWQGKKLGVFTEKVKVAGKSVFALYLIPENYKVMDDENGYTVIVSKDAESAAAAPAIDEDEE